MFDFIKLLLEQPDKRGKFLIVITKLSVNVFFASWLYTKFISPYRLIDVADFGQWVNFFVSGRVLLCVFMYLMADVVLYHLLPIIPGLILDWLAKPKTITLDRDGQKVLFGMLNRFELVYFDAKTERLKWAKHSDEFYASLIAMNRRETRDEIGKVKKQYMDDIFGNFLAFYLLYLAFLHPSTYPWLTVVITLGFLLVIVFYIVGNTFLQVLQENFASVLLLLKGLKEEHKVHNEMRSAGLFLFDKEVDDKGRMLPAFVLNDQEYLLFFLYRSKELRSRLVTKAAAMAETKGLKALIVTNAQLNAEAATAAEEVKERVAVVSYANHTELLQKLKTHFAG